MLRCDPAAFRRRVKKYPLVYGPLGRSVVLVQAQMYKLKVAMGIRLEPDRYICLLIKPNTDGRRHDHLMQEIATRNAKENGTVLQTKIESIASS